MAIWCTGQNLCYVIQRLKAWNLTTTAFIHLLAKKQTPQKNHTGVIEFLHLGFQIKKRLCSCQTTDEICACTDACICSRYHCTIGRTFRHFKPSMTGFSNVFLSTRQTKVYWLDTLLSATSWHLCACRPTNTILIVPSVGEMPSLTTLLMRLIVWNINIIML